jgi:dTMP kinase
MALLFAADRMDHVESEIATFVSAGGIVVSDRYDASSLAYQSVSSGVRAHEVLEWIRAINAHAPRPDLTLVLDVEPEVAAGRRMSRGEAAQLYEHDEMQRALRAFYRDLARHLPGDRLAIIDADGTPDEVEARVWAVYQAAFRGR